MKTVIARFFAASLLLIMLSCNDEKKKVETTTTTHEQREATRTERKKTEISVGPGGAEVKTKSGTEVKVSDKGAAVGSKDVKIDIKNKNNK